jgi:FMN phosphatase YigB (HAD superfamily)
VFDLGDTVSPAREFSRRFFRQELQDRGVENPPEYPFEGYNEFVPESIQQWLDAEDLEIDGKDLVEAYLEAKREQIVDSGVLEQLRRISEQLGPIGVVSNNRLEAKRFYSRLFEDGGVEVEGFVVSEEIGIRKPEPGIFREFLDRRGVEPESCVYFGNRADIDSSCQELGMEFVFVEAFDNFGTSWSGDSIQEINLESVRRLCG